jgi:hypothetical protein
MAAVFAGLKLSFTAAKRKIIIKKHENSEQKVLK